MKISRMLLALALSVCLLAAMGCSTEPPKKKEAKEAAPAKAEVQKKEIKPITFGLIMVGPYNDKGYSQAEYEGGKYVEAHFPGSKMIYLDSVNPADRPGLTIPQVCDDMIEKGATLIIAGSDDMKDGILEAAAQHPDITFVHVSGDAAWTGKATPNLGNLFARMEYSKMMSGFAAAMTTKTGKIGVIGPLINDETRRLINSAYLGARYAWTEVRHKDPKDLTFTVKWIGFWFNIPGVTADPTQVAGSLYDSGHDVVISDIDTPNNVTVAKQRRDAGQTVWALPYDYAKACEGQGEVCLGVPYFNWGPEFLDLTKSVAAGTYKPGFVWNAPYWPDINDPDKGTAGFNVGDGLSEDAKTALAKFISDLGDGKLNLFTGPLNYQDGTPFLKAGETATDKQIWYMSQLLEGMDGLSAPSK